MSAGLAAAPPAAERGGVPLYREILDRLVDEIAAGIHPVGGRFPTEQELCARYGASRHTVRAALRNLQELGLIRRRQGSGSVVAATRPRPRYASSIGSLEDLLQYAESTWLERLTLDRLLLDDRLAARLGCEAGTPWLRVTALRRMAGGGLPLAYTEVYLPARFEAVALQVGQVRQAVCRMLEQGHNVRITDVHQTMEAMRAPARAARHLGLAPGDPLLQIDRRYEAGAEGLVEVALNSHPPGRFRYDLSLRQPPLRALPMGTG